MSNIIISSAKRSDEKDSPSNFSLEFDRPLKKGTYSLCYGYFPNSVKTIVTGGNDTFLLNGSLVTLASGIYGTTASFATIVQTALNAVLAGFTVTITDNVINIQNGTAFTLDFRGREVAKTMGFPKTLQPTTTNLTGSGFVNFSTNSFGYNVLLNNFVSYEDNKSNGYTFRIPITSNSLGYTSYEPNGWVQSVEIPRPLNRLEVKIFDDDHNLVDLNLVDWYIYLSK